MLKGQLFSVDFLVSMIAVTAAIGLLIHSAEVNAYSQKEEQLYNELKQVAETAADLLVASNDTACEVIETGEHLVNCVNSKTSEEGLRQLFPGSGYGYQICSDTINLDCGTYREGDYYEAKRLVVTNQGSIGKHDFETGNFTSGGAIEISVRVWRT